MKNDNYIKKEMLDIKNDQILLRSFSDMGLNLANLDFFTQYYAAYYKDDFKDSSFGVSDGNVLIAFVLCYNINKKLCMPAGGIEIFFKESKPNKKLSNFIVNQINIIASGNQSEEISIRDKLTSKTLSALGETLLLDHYSCRTTFNMNVPFVDFSESIFFSNMRKSYKSLINWGHKNLRVETIKHNSLDSNLFNDFKEFHRHVSGRKTRSDLTWDTQYKMIKNAHAELILAYLNDELVAGSFIADFGIQSIYFTGVYNRDLFKHGISHYLVYKSIVESFHRGKTLFFSLGDFDAGITDDKWFNIQFFKKGFCKDLTPQIIWSKTIS